MYGLDLAAAFFAVGVLFCTASALLNGFVFKDTTSKANLLIWWFGSVLLAILVLINFVIYSGMVK